MNKMRMSLRPALPAPPGKFTYVAILATVLVLAGLAVLIVESGAIATLNHSGLLR